MESKSANETLAFVWWNTSLAPTRGTPPTPAQLDVALQVVSTLIASGNIDLVALGEVSESEVAVFRAMANAQGYDLINGCTAVGKSRFDTLFLHKTSRLTVSAPVSIVTEKGQRMFRVAQRIDVSIVGAKRPIHIFVSHWSSRLSTDADRELLGMRLRDHVDNLFKLYTATPDIILLGDYNDEPFDKSLTDRLLSTRDRNLAKLKSHLLYNPFWRYLGAACGDPKEQYWTLGGTYYHQSGDNTRWRLFDQMIFSTSFLADGEWLLDESLTKVADIPDYSTRLDRRSEIFDHAPIIGVVRRV